LADYELDGKETKWTLVVNSWLRQLAAGEHKDREIIKLLKGELKDEQLVIWFAFNAELYRLHDTLTKLGISCRYITGDVSISKRGKLVDRFNAKKYQVILMQLKCGKYGLDLSGADTAIYYSASYEAETRIQSVPRIVHPKKDRPCLIIDIVTRNTIDEDIREALLTKDIDSKGILSSIKSALEREQHGRKH
jgi:SNF2 family DNA or RNA helicase